MSGEEDNELRDLVAQTLENNGELPKIRAQLRASVYLALEEHYSTKGQGTSKNKDVNDFLMSAEGCLATSLIIDFLECFNMDYTKSVFESEASLQNINIKSRDELIQHLGVQEGDYQIPIISLHLQKSIFKKSEEMENTQTIILEPTSQIPTNQEHGNQNSINHNTSSPETRPGLQGPQIGEEKLSMNNTFDRSSNSGLRLSYSSSSGFGCSDTDGEGIPDESDVEDPATANFVADALNKLDASAIAMFDHIKSEQKPLGLLPPLTSNTCSQEKSLEQIIAIMDIASPVSSLEVYEEDFQSSGSQADGGEVRGRGASESAEEIAEEVVSGQSSVSLPSEDNMPEITLDTSAALTRVIPSDLLEEA